MARYGKKAQETVEEAMKRFKKGELKSGKSEKIEKSIKQAVAIGLSRSAGKGSQGAASSKKVKVVYGRYPLVTTAAAKNIRFPENLISK